MKNRTDRPNLLVDPIVQTLKRMSMPMAIAFMLIATTVLADAAFIGLLGKEALASIGLALPVVAVTSTMLTGLSVGVTATIALAKGAGEEILASRITRHSIWLGCVFTTVFWILAALIHDHIFRALGATASTIHYLETYLGVWVLGLVFSVIVFVATAALRAVGDTKTTTISAMTASLINLILDPIMIFGIGPIPRLELIGAAMATVIGTACAAALALYALFERSDLLVPVEEPFSNILVSWRRILAIGIPAIATQVLPAITLAVLTAVIARYGDTILAAYSIGIRIERLILVVPLAISAGIGPLVSQNWGAQQVYRAIEAVHIGRVFSWIFGLSSWFVLAVPIALLVKNVLQNSDVLEELIVYIWIVPASYAAAGAIQVSISALNAIGRARRGTLVAIVRFVLTLVCAVIGSWVGGAIGLFCGIVAAHLIADIYAFRSLAICNLTATNECDYVKTK